MKIEGPRQTGAVGAPHKAGAGAAPGFSVPTSGAGAAAAIAETGATTSLASLMALQTEIYDPRRKGRQVKRGRATLAALEALMRATLSGEAPHAARLTLVKLQGDIEFTGDPALDDLLAQIDLRAAVELAKLDMAEQARA
jgi:hypothetical protein